ncbi:MAG: cysteine desulfurase NifS [Clostridiales bacterium]|jgi:cysteine desulfurase|nr:cysteine desulfurase NifS [Clostridiales bacterium]
MADRFIYLDHAATTAVHPAVFEKMAPYFHGYYGNPSSVYSIARATKQAIDQAREDVAAAFGASAKEIYFTGSGTEADNWAIKGAAFAAAAGGKGKHIITSAIEHHAVLETCEWLEKQGFRVTYLPVDEYGMVSLVDLQRAMRDDTALVSVMAANNEIGTIQPIQEIGRIARERGAVFHTDAVQAAGTLALDVARQNIDLMSISAHKFYGPKGVGALYVRAGTRIERFMHGGGQERGRRAGTENVAGIVGLAEALKLAVAGMDETNARLSALRDRTISAVLAAVPHARLNGHPTQRLPNNASFAFRYIEGESLLLMLDMKGIGASSGSACTSGSLDPSHVLLAIGLPHEIAHGSLRITFGTDNTQEDADRLVEALPPIVGRLRDMSPLYEDFVKGGEGGEKHV